MVECLILAAVTVIQGVPALSTPVPAAASDADPEKGNDPIQSAGEVAAARALPKCFVPSAKDLASRCPRTLREYFRSGTWVPSNLSAAELQLVRDELVALCVAAESACTWEGDLAQIAPDIDTLQEWVVLLDAESRRLAVLRQFPESAQCIRGMFGIARALALIPRLEIQREASRSGWQGVQRARPFLSQIDDVQLASGIRAAAQRFADAQDASSGRSVAVTQLRWNSAASEAVRMGADGASLFRLASSDPAVIVDKKNEYPLSRLTGEALQKELRTGDSYFAAAATAWNSVDAPAQLWRLSARAAKGEFGGWIAAVRPDFFGVRDELVKGRRELLAFYAEVERVCPSTVKKTRRAVPNSLRPGGGTSTTPPSSKPPKS